MKYIITESQLKLRRILWAIDELVDWYLEDTYNPDKRYDFFGYYDSPEMVYNVITQGIIERMYYDYFGDMDDDSKEWGKIYDLINGYMKSYWKDKIIAHYTEIWEK